MKWHSADGGYVEYFGSGRAIRAVASDYSDLNNATSISISAWANPRITSRRAIASRWWSGQAQQFNHLFENAPAGRFWYDSRGAISGKYGATDSGLYNINEWSHFVWLYDVSDGFARWYVNGVEKDAIDWGTDGGNGMSVGAFTTPIGIGTRADIYETFDGFMGSLKIYTDVLTPTEISDVFNNEKSRFGL
jgi:hypothetical protein